MTKRRSFSDKFKATVALEALGGDKTALEIAAKHKVHLLPAGVCLQTPIGDAGDDVDKAGHRWADGRVFR
ncbi:hypothetical protein OO012_06205 [Rhodobacteraceae bacterium KMM 6894]|nr:hypothetical protein [Rhodobacteraceae bacterium KMM 6894]